MRVGPLHLYTLVFSGSLILLGVELLEPDESLLAMEAPPRAVAPLDKMEEEVPALGEPGEDVLVLNKQQEDKPQEDKLGEDIPALDVTGEPDERPRLPSGPGRGSQEVRFSLPPGHHENHLI
jgi:hypothetical protein